MALPEAKSRVLEEGDEALIAGSIDKPETDGEEIVYASLEEQAAEAEQAGKKPAEEKPAAPAAGAKPAAKPAAAAGEDEIPEEYRGKTPAQLAKMLRDAQGLIGRQGSELGDLRKHVDTAIQTSLAALHQSRAKPAEAAPAKPAEETLDESRFFAEPHASVSKLIENHPLIKEIRATLGQAAANTEAQRAQAASERFQAAHPDSQEILRDPEFRQWVSASPIRQSLLQRAHTKFDFHAGDEVFGTWKALKGVRSGSAAGTKAGDGAPASDAVSEAARTLAAARAAKTTAASQQAAAQAASVPTGGGAGAGKAGGGGKKIYRRADVLKLMEENPERYEALADELTLAYKENRVR